MATFPTRLKELRAKKGLSQPQLAEIMGVTKQTISLWERGIRRPDFVTMNHLADFLEVRMMYMLGEIDDDTRPPEPKNSDLARSAIEEDDENLRELASKLVRLSPDSRKIVSATLSAAFRLDRERELLADEDAYIVTVRSKCLDDGRLEKDEVD